MAFSLYQSLRTVPAELQEAARVFQLSAWQRFWRLELPFAMPGLLWNMMMSMSGGWFFVVASEAISVSNQNIKLPGVGSYIALAIEARDIGAIGWAILGMLVGIVLYDQLFFRPLLAWADKFRFEESQQRDGAAPRGCSTWMRRTDRLQRLGWSASRTLRALGRCSFRRPYDGTSIRAPHQAARSDAGHAPGTPSSPRAVLFAVWHLFALHPRRSRLATRSGTSSCWAGYTMARVLVLIALAALVWVPVGVWIGMNPRWSGRLQAVAQFLAAFPANLMFPVAVLLHRASGTSIPTSGCRR